MNVGNGSGEERLAEMKLGTNLQPAADWRLHACIDGYPVAGIIDER